MPVNTETVTAACEALRARGFVPTVELVRRELPGGGSPNAITPLVRAWKDAEHARRAAAEVQPEDPLAAEARTLPPPLQRVLDALTAAVANIPLAANQALAEVAETERRRSALDVDAARRAAQEQVAAARAEAADERANTDAVRAEVDEKEAELGRLTRERDEAWQAVDDAKARVGTLEQERDQALKGRSDAEAQAGRLGEQVKGFGAAAQEAQTRAAGAQAAADEIRVERDRLRDQLGSGHESALSVRQREKVRESRV